MFLPRNALAGGLSTRVAGLPRVSYDDEWIVSASSQTGRLGPGPGAPLIGIIRCAESVGVERRAGNDSRIHNADLFRRGERIFRILRANGIANTIRRAIIDDDGQERAAAARSASANYGKSFHVPEGRPGSAADFRDQAAFASSCSRKTVASCLRSNGLLRSTLSGARDPFCTAASAA